MSNKNGNICRFCLKSICDSNFGTIEEIMKHMLDVLLLNLDLEITVEPIMCNECSKNLQLSFDFKLRYHNMNKTIPFEYSTGNDDNKCTSVDEDNILCQICIKNTEEDCLSALYEFQDEFIENLYMSDILQKHVKPELDFSIPEQVVICTSCLESLQVLLRFVAKCLEVEDKIRRYVELADRKGQIELDDVQQFTFKMLVSDETELKHCTAGEPEIKEEPIEDITEIQEEITLKDEVEDFTEIDESKCSFVSSEVEMITEQDDSKRFGDSVSPQPKVTTRLHVRRECLKPNFEGDLSKPYIKSTSAEVNATKITIFQCDCCSFQAKSDNCLKNHLLTHESPSERLKYRCNSCSYQTDQKDHLKTHLLVHKYETTSKVSMYKCDSCSFQTKHRGSLFTHLLRHKDSSEVTVYKCDSCSFQTKYRCSIKTHLRLHVRPSEITMYNCDSCSFQTVHERSLKAHLLVHKNLSEVTIYKCDYCSYKAKRKGNLKSHLLLHKSPLEATVYKCHSCSFHTRRKHSIRTHQLVHKGSSEVTVYKCHSCSFQTKHKGSLKAHVLVHKAEK